MSDGRYNQNAVDKLYPGAIMYPAMKVWQLPNHKKNMLQEICDGGDYFGEIKKDGNFYAYVVSENGQPYLFSRNESVTTNLLTEKIENVPHFYEQMQILPPNTILIGEVYVPGGDSNDVRKIMGCKPALAIKRQKEQGLIKFYVFDIVYFNGVSLLDRGAFERYKILKQIYTTLEFDKTESIELAEAYEEGLYILIQKALEAGEEGVVLKKKDCPYYPGLRPAWSMIKVKQIDYADVVCMGFEPPTKYYDGDSIETWSYWIREEDGMRMQGNFYGQEGYAAVTKPYYYSWIGSILIGAYDESNVLKSVGTVSSGLTDELRNQIRDNPENYINKVCMVQCMEKFEGALRHPILKGFRDDKNPKDCLLKEIFDK